MLDFEQAWPRHSGAKEEAIIRQLGMKPARYYQLLRRAAASMEGQAHDALTAHRVLRRAHTLPTGSRRNSESTLANMTQHSA
ncbi:DUF3263 domain-containing protein [Microbacterium sp. 2FI]|uniref:DUF3263 domain-containing protein n=1 Tax=Microbacterium sp. 2FI TaxID=2502193 RepID=UPI0020168DD8|nr:DUF3263 domain-containing protein [Microbacterium sp. 2FI]